MDRNQLAAFLETEKGLGKKKQCLLEQLNIRVIGLGWQGWKLKQKGILSGKLEPQIQVLWTHLQTCFSDPNLNALPIPQSLSLNPEVLPHMSKQHATQQFLELEKKTAVKWDRVLEQFREVDVVPQSQPAAEQISSDDSNSTEPNFAFLLNYLRTCLL